MKINFTIFSAPRTKKTSNRIVHIKPKAGSGGRGFTKILPSAAHEEWFEFASMQMLKIVGKLQAQGVPMPITGPVAVNAQFYLEVYVGDWCGFTQALGDLLGWKQRNKETKIVTHLGVIADDKQIVHFDGTRLHHDAANPRIEVELELLQGILI